MKRILPWLTLAIALALLVGIYLYVQHAIEANNSRIAQPRPPAKENPLNVTVVTVSPAKHAAQIQAVGLASPRYDLTLTNQVAGEIITMSPSFDVGEQVRQGQTLLTLRNVELSADLASAQNDVATSELALKEEQRQVEQANAEWRAAGLEGEPASDLVLRAPQLAAAQADLTSAKAALALAQDNVKKLKITAPFDGIITAQNASPGEYLSSNSELATLYSSDEVSIELQLSAQDWNKLPTGQQMLAQNWQASIRSIDGQQQWQGYVKRVGLHVNSESGLRSLYIAVDRPLELTPALLPGSYVSVIVQGMETDNLWQLPNSALSQKSQIWYVNADNRLANFDATPRFVDQDYVYIDVPENLAQAPQKILTQPYNSYLKGMLVTPEEVVSP
ncbi:efflux RND transporter periplasmic adaptor subunit [Rhodanobacter aciditrophus]|uniref:Efflux RND transporter periplasmic adaptor subunit n=1 Tax=Rhodanobacter aciditrophus TaxID=1623218 RepID=A0ABW4B3B4_9GAMM